jgi:hypothetical protein
VFQIVDFSSIHDLKFTYVHLQFQKFFPEVIPPDPHDKGEGRERGEGKGKERKGRGWDGVNPPKTNPGYGPIYRQIVTASRLQENADSDVWHT